MRPNKSETKVLIQLFLDRHRECPLHGCFAQRWIEFCASPEFVRECGSMVIETGGDVLGLIALMSSQMIELGYRFARAEMLEELHAKEPAKVP